MIVSKDLGLKRVVVDVQTRKDGATAVVAFRNVDIEVYFGPLCASVWLRKLRLYVVMNPDEGNWSDADWAYEQAVSVIRQPLVLPTVLIVLAELHAELGRAEGRMELQAKLRSLIGVPREFDDDC